MEKAALILSAGGARGAYQAGVVKAISEMGLSSDSPFDTYCGVSAGSINAGSLASLNDNFADGVSQLEDVWSHLPSEKVFRTDLKSLSGIGVKWMKDLSLGGVLGGGKSRALLDTSPLRELLTEKVPLHRIGPLIENNKLKALGVTCTNYYTSNAVTFVQTTEDIQMWKRRRRVGEKCEVTVEHLMGSSAIPVFFPSIEIDGRHFGDGCVRNVAPLSPAIHLGSKKIVAVGVRQSSEVSEQTSGPRAHPSMAQIFSLILDAVLLDSIELDIVRIRRVNDILKTLRATEFAFEEQQYRPIDVVWISPSEDIGRIATTYYKKLPRVVRYLLKGLGPDAPMTDIVSFLLFDPAFCTRLIELGYKDGMSHKEELEKLYST